jgi:hypothetical protein
MLYLHESAIKSHRFSNDTACHIDSRFILKIGGYGFESLRSKDDLEPFHVSQENRNLRILLWRAPGFVRGSIPPSGTQKGEVPIVILKLSVLTALRRILKYGYLDMYCKETIKN